MDERLRRVFAEVFRIDPNSVRDATSPEDVKGWDSMGHLALVNALEAEFDLRLEDADVAELETVGRIKDILRLRGVPA